MPKPAVNAYLRAGEFKNDGLYATDANTLMCRHCNCLVAYEKRDGVVKHVKTTKHETAAKKVATTSENKIQTSVLTSFNSAKRRKVSIENLAMKTTEAFAKANIPLEKLEDPNLRSWMCEFIEGAGDLPCVKTLREKYVPKLAQEREDSLKDLVRNRKVFILSDETTDSKGRCVFVVLFKIFFDKLEDPVLKVASVSFLEKADATTCTQVLNECVHKYDIQFCDIQGLVTDSARYMTKCVSSLQVLFGEHVLHVQCWAHKLALVGSVMACELQDVNEGVVKVKAAFLNTRKRRHHYLKYLAENTEKPAILFPMPVCTRWNSWFKSVFYLSEYLVDIISFFKQEDLKVENSGIQYLRSLSTKTADILLAQCHFVKMHAGNLVEILTKLEGSKYPTAHLLNGYLDDLQKDFDGISQGIFSAAFQEKMSSLTTTDKALVKQRCQNASALCMDKLQGLQNSDPSANIFKALNKAFSPKHILLNNTKDILPTIKCIPGIGDVDDCVLFKGYESLKEAVQEAAKTGQECDVQKILVAIGTEQKSFAAAALQAIWIPTNNVDSERLLSHYNHVITDRRQNLKEKNIESFTMLSFDN